MNDSKEKKNLYKIKINTPDVGYESFPVSIINRSVSETLSFDPSLGKPASIFYKLTKAGTIRLRIVRRDNPDVLLLTLLDWTDQAFGEHEVKWDGHDASGNIIDNKKVLIIFESRDQTGGKHRDHDSAVCCDPGITIKSRPETKEHVRGNLEICIFLSEEADKLQWSSGCEISCFIDYKLSKKETFQKKQKEFTLVLNTADLDSGEHFITVNINDFSDHIGTASLKITATN